MLGGALASVFARTSEDLAIEEDRYHDKKERGQRRLLQRLRDGRDGSVEQRHQVAQMV